LRGGVIMIVRGEVQRSERPEYLFGAVSQY
jgi:hypothetical protein